MVMNNFNNEAKNSVFGDKMAISLAVINQETKIINIYSELLYKIKRGYFIDEKALIEYPDYNLCWQKISELYFFIENDKVVDAEKNNSEEVKQLKNIMARYEKMNDVLEWKELIYVFGIIRKIIVSAGYHENSINGKSFTNQPQRGNGIYND